MIAGKDKIAYVVADLKRIGPTNQTFNIIRHSGAINNCVVITLFKECDDSRIDDYIAAGIDVKCLNLSRKNVLLQGAKKLRDMLKQVSPCAVHSWGTYADIVSYYACKKIKMPHIITLRCFPMEDAPTRMNPIIGYGLALCVLHIYKNSKYIVACSKSIKDKMEANYKWAKLSFIQNGVDINQFKKIDYKESRERLGINPNEIVFISMGSMIPRKRIDETIEAFLECKDLSNKRLWILGDGYLLESLKNKYQNDKVEFMGKIRDVVPYLSAADVFVSSSESEGMPNAVLEAIACEKPVILSNIPQHIEVFDAIEGCGVSYALGNKKELSDILSNITREKILKLQGMCSNIMNSSLVMSNMGKCYMEYYRKIENGE